MTSTYLYRYFFVVFVFLDFLPSVYTYYVVMSLITDIRYQVYQTYLVLVYIFGML